jgi:hypothetical protein
MAVAFIQEWKNAAPGTSNYDAVGAKLDARNNPPEGLIAHTAGRDSNGVFASSTSGSRPSTRSASRRSG